MNMLQLGTIVLFKNRDGGSSTGLVAGYALVDIAKGVRAFQAEGTTALVPYYVINYSLDNKMAVVHPSDVQEYQP